MSEGFFSRGLAVVVSKATSSGRIPPGQYLERGFPVLSAGPTPHTSLASWDFSIVGEVDQPKRWSWDEFRALPRETVTKDIHCVTKWSKLDTHWEGVSLDTLLAQVTYRCQLCDRLQRWGLYHQPAPGRGAGWAGLGGRHL